MQTALADQATVLDRADQNLLAEALTPPAPQDHLEETEIQGLHKDLATVTPENSAPRQKNKLLGVKKYNKTTAQKGGGFLFGIRPNYILPIIPIIISLSIIMEPIFFSACN